MKKIFQIVLTTLIITTTITGCSFQKQTKPQTTEIEFWTLQLGDFAPYINGIIKDYETQHPNITIKWIDVPFSEGEKRALAAVMSKDVPDVINMNPSFASTLATRGALENIKPYLTQNQYNEYIPASWEVTKFNDGMYSVPWYITSAITVYNKQIFKQAGISNNSIPKTYDDIERISPIIKKKTGKYTLMPNLTEDGYILKIFNKYDIPIFNQEHTKALFNTPKSAQILTFWKEMYTKNYIPQESITQTHRDSLEKFQSGETAIIIAGANFLKIIQQNAPALYENLGVSKQITGSNGKVDFSIMNLVVPTKSEHKKEAIDFALYVTNATNQSKFCELAPILPSTKKSLESNIFKKNSNLFEQGQSLSAAQLKDAITPIPQVSNQKDLYQLVDFMTQEVLLSKKTAKQALNDTKTNWDKILKENQK